MNDVSPKLIDEFVQACHEVASHGLVRCSSGNMSFRLDGERFLATASRSWMANLSREEVSICHIVDGSVLDGPKATVEIGFHAGILKSRPDVNVVLHFQTPFATTLACRHEGDINYFVIPEIPFYLGHVARVPYLLPGSEHLAEAVTAAMQEHDMVVMGNHGEATVAKDYSHAIQNAEFFELACQIIVQGATAQSPLSEEDVTCLLESRNSANGV